jgi:hypothetical protein
MYKSILVLLFSLLLIGCAAKTKVIADLKSIGGRDLLAQNEQWQKSFSTLKGSAKITLDSPQFSGTFGADILLNNSDSLLITITGPMGIKLGKAFVSPNRFVFYNQMMNQFMAGSLDDYEDTNFMQFPLEISQLRNVFAAREDFNILELSTYEIRDGYYYLETQNDYLTYHIWFDPASLLIKKIEYFNRKVLVFYKEYGQFEKFNGIYFPRLVNFVRPQEKQGMSIYYDEISINKPFRAEQFDINISDNARQIELSIENGTGK